MKKTLSLVVALALCLSLCACGGAKKLSSSEIKSQLSDFSGTLNITTSGDYVKSFTYVLEDIYTAEMYDATHMLEVMVQVLNGNGYNVKLRDLDALQALQVIIQINLLLLNEDDAANNDTLIFVEECIDVLCNKKTIHHNGWDLSATVDQSKDIVTISVQSN